MPNLDRQLSKIHILLTAALSRPDYPAEVEQAEELLDDLRTKLAQTPAGTGPFLRLSKVRPERVGFENNPTGTDGHFS